MEENGTGFSFENEHSRSTHFQQYLSLRWLFSCVKGANEEVFMVEF